MKLHRTLLALLFVMLCAAAPTSAQLEWDKRVADAPLPNPVTLHVSREKAMEYVKSVLDFYGHEVKSSSCDEARGICTVLTEPLVFTRGIVADSQFRHVAELGAGSVRNVVRGRVTLRIEVSPVNPGVTTAGFFGSFEGLAEGAMGTEWVAARSRGMYEDRLLRGMTRVANGLSVPEDGGTPDEPTDDDPVKPGTAKKP